MCIYGSAQIYLQKLLPVVRAPDAMHLRSETSHKLDIAACSNSQARESVFQYVGPNLWNSLPQNIRIIPNFDIFKSNLKTYLFTRSHPKAVKYDFNK